MKSQRDQASEAQLQLERLARALGEGPALQPASLEPALGRLLGAFEARRRRTRRTALALTAASILLALSGAWLLAQRPLRTERRAVELSPGAQTAEGASATGGSRSPSRSPSPPEGPVPAGAASLASTQPSHFEPVARALVDALERLRQKVSPDDRAPLAEWLDRAPPLERAFEEALRLAGVAPLLAASGRSSNALVEELVLRGVPGPQPDPETVEAAACLWLARSTSPARIALLSERAAQGRGAGRAAALRGLAFDGAEGQAALAERLRDPARAPAVAAALAEWPAGTALRWIERVLGSTYDSTPAVEIALCTRALAQGERGLDRLLERLDPPGRAAQTLANSLAQALEGAPEALLDSLAGRVGSRRGASALEVLSRIPDPRALATLLELGDLGRGPRFELLAALDRSRAESPALWRRLAEQGTRRQRALLLEELLERPGPTAALVPLIDDADLDRDARLWAVGELELRGEPADLEELGARLFALGSGDHRLAAAIVICLARRGQARTLAESIAARSGSGDTERLAHQLERAMARDLDQHTPSALAAALRPLLPLPELRASPGG